MERALEVKSKLMKAINVVFMPGSLWLEWDRKYGSGAPKEPEKEYRNMGDWFYEGEKLITGIAMGVLEAGRVAGYVILANSLLENS